jgi:hypothetical protein
MTDSFDHLSRPDLVIACLERPGDVARYIEQLRQRLDEGEERSKACDHIAEGLEGWQVLRNLCMSTQSVAALRDQYDVLAAARSLSVESSVTLTSEDSSRATAGAS